MGTTLLNAALNAQGRRLNFFFYTATEASRLLGRPVAQVLRAVRELGLPVRRGGAARNSPFLLTEEEVVSIKLYLSGTK